MRAQGEVFNGAILQQSFSVDFVVADQPCIDCNRHAANPNVWTACVQVRLQQQLLPRMPWMSVSSPRLIISGLPVYVHEASRGWAFAWRGVPALFWTLLCPAAERWGG